MNPDIEKWLDLEADVDEEEEESDDELQNELLMQFLNDEHIDAEDEAPALRHNEMEKQRDASKVDWDAYLNRARRRGARIQVQDESEHHAIEDLLPFVPKPDDYPLWRIPCRIGVEYSAMELLFNTVHEHHEVRSVVVRDSIQGFIYIEATMNQKLMKLLSITPGIITSKAGVRKKGIPSNDVANLFKMDDESTRFRKGVWVNIREGLYREDVGLVIGVEDWCIEVLVVPRLSKPSDCNPQKRKRSTAYRPSPNLFDPLSSPPANLIQTGENSYKIGSVRIEHGLSRRVYDYTALDLKVEDIAYTLFKKFLWSRHPAVLDADIPRPREWKFDVNDRVVVLSSGLLSQVNALYPTYLEVKRNLNSELHGYSFIDDDHERVRWHNIQKSFDIGDYVKVTGGPHLGRCGWLVSTEGENADLNLVDGRIMRTAKEISVPINCLQLSEVAPNENVETGIVANKPRERRHRWIGRRVVVTKLGHPSKGMTGTVKDVILTGPENPSDSIVVEFGGVIRPGLPFEKIVIRAEDVLFVVIPIPIETPDEGPAPSTPTDFPDDYLMEVFDVPSEPEHVLLRSCFEGLEVKAIVKGGSFESQKEKLVQVVKIDDRLLLRTKNQRTVVTLEPTWVTLMHPKAKGDNNLLVFICGDHLGRFCRRIHHRDEISGPVSIYVAIVERHPDNGDSLSGEQVEAPMNCFAIVSETKVEKDNKNRLMSNLRQAWR